MEHLATKEPDISLNVARDQKQIYMRYPGTQNCKCFSHLGIPL